MISNLYDAGALPVAQKGGFFRGVRTWLAKTLWPSHYARMEINALNVDAIGLGATGLTDEVLREAGMERV